MLNCLTLVGRLVDQPKFEEGNTSIKLAVSRSFKNADGEYETDIIPVKLYDMIAKNTCEYCKKGDLVGIKGRLQSIDNLEVIAEKLTFLSSNHTGEE